MKLIFAAVAALLVCAVARADDLKLSASQVAATTNQFSRLSPTGTLLQVVLDHIDDLFFRNDTGTAYRVIVTTGDVGYASIGTNRSYYTIVPAFAGSGTYDYPLRVVGNYGGAEFYIGPGPSGAETISLSGSTYDGMAVRIRQVAMMRHPESSLVFQFVGTYTAGVSSAGFYGLNYYGYPSTSVPLYQGDTADSQFAYARTAGFNTRAIVSTNLDWYNSFTAYGPIRLHNLQFVYTNLTNTVACPENASFKAAVRLYGNGGNHVVEGCVFQGTGTNGGAAIYCSGPGVYTIYDCVFSNAGYAAIWADNGATVILDGSNVVVTATNDIGVYANSATIFVRHADAVPPGITAASNLVGGAQWHLP